MYQLPFEEFVSKFVIEYWTDVKRGAPEFADHTEPVDESLEDLLSQINYSISEPNILNMKHEIGEGWQIIFEQTQNGWRVSDYSAGPNSYLTKRNYFCSVYKPLFEPFFNRICDNVYRT